MNRTVALLLTLLYSATLLQAYMPHVNYWMNRAYIISELCENRDRPDLECNGKCHLKKQIESSTERQEGQGAVVSVRMMVEFFQPAYRLILRTFDRSENVEYCSYKEEPIVGFSRSVFHPPKA
jgi:hypothetical protein